MNPRKFVAIGLFVLTFAVQAQEVKWYTFEEAIELNKTEPRKLVVDVYTDWCSWCKVMDRSTFSDSLVGGYMNANYYPVKLNAEQKEEITVNQVTYRYIAQGSRGYHELAAALLQNQLSYPSVVFIDENFQIIHVQKGFTQSAQFHDVIRYIGGDHYKTMSWEGWKDAEKTTFSKN